MDIEELSWTQQQRQAYGDEQKAREAAAADKRAWKRQRTETRQGSGGGGWQGSGGDTSWQGHGHSGDHRVPQTPPTPTFPPPLPQPVVLQVAPPSIPNALPSMPAPIDATMPGMPMLQLVGPTGKAQAKKLVIDCLVRCEASLKQSMQQCLINARNLQHELVVISEALQTFRNME